MRDPYKILGLPQRATEADVKSAFRRLAKLYHPDLHPGDQRNLERFREINDAYDELTQEFRRNRDATDTDFGIRRHRRSQPHAGNQTGGPAPGSKSSPTEAERQERRRTAEEVFGDFFNGFKGTERKADDTEDLTYRLKLSLEDAALGTTSRVQLRNGKKLDIKIPSGVEDGQQIRLRGQGAAGKDGAASGDTIITITVKDHPWFTRHGANIHMELPVTVDEAVLGAKVNVPTVDGEVVLNIPPGSNTDSIFRLKGKGGMIRGKTDEFGRPLRGDQYVSLKVVLPAPSDKGFAKLIKRWAAKSKYSVRKHLESRDKAA